MANKNCNWSECERVDKGAELCVDCPYREENFAGDMDLMRDALKEARRVLRKIYKPEISPLDGDNRLISATVGIINAALFGTKRNGDSAKMREALEKIAHYDDNGDGMDDPYCADGHICADIAREALAAPPRNCDVGTAEEQERRFRKYCETEECNRYRCGHGCKAVCIDRCAVAWAQMPYEEGDAK